MTLQKVVEFDRNRLGLHPVAVAKTAGGALIAAELGRWIVYTGAASATLTLPNPAGNANKCIAFEVPDTSAATVVLTIAPYGADLLNTYTSNSITRGERIIYRTDGTNWYSVIEDFPDPVTTDAGAWNTSPAPSGALLNTFFSTAIGVTIPPLGWPPPGKTWKVLLTGGTRWTVGPANSLMLISFDGGGVHGGTLWPGLQTFCAWSGLMAPINFTASQSWTVRLYCTVAGTYTLASGSLIAIPQLVSA